MSLKVKFRTMFPALVFAESPLEIVKAGLKYTFSLNIDSLIANLTPFNNTFTINPPVNTADQGLVINQTLPTNGTSASSYSANLTIITNPNYTSTATGYDTAHGLINGIVVGSRLNYLSAGSGAGQLPIQIGGLVAAEITSQGQQLVGFHAGASSNTASAGNDRLWGFTGYTYLGPLANLNGAYSVDAQSGVEVGAVVVNRAGVSVGSIGAQAATTMDSAIAIYSAPSLIPGSTVPFTNGITLWSPGATPPIASTGSIITADVAFSVANFANLANVTITGSIFSFPNMAVDASGAAVFGAGVGSIVSKTVLASFNANQQALFQINNPSVGTAAFPGFAAYNGTGTGTFGIGGTGYTGAGGFLTNKAFVFSNASANGIAVYASGATPIDFYVNGVRAGGFTTGGDFQTKAVAVASLPAAAAGLKAARSFVTDANATMTAGIGAVVVGGGANNVPVYCDGTNWRIG